MSATEGGEQQLADTLGALIAEAIANRLRFRALLELIEERGLIERETIDGHIARVMERDWNSLVGEMLPPSVAPYFRREAD